MKSARTDIPRLPVQTSAPPAPAKQPGGALTPVSVHLNALVAKLAKQPASRES